MYDLIVIGAGAVGSATAYRAAKAGARVLLLEQYAIDHQQGSSYGYSRIIRYAYDHPAYVALAQSAYPAWREFEEDSGETIYIRTAGLDFAVPGEPLFENMVANLTQMKVPHEVMTAEEVRRLFPQFMPSEDMLVLYQVDAGVLRASVSVRAHVRLAQRYGAEVLDNAPVRGIQPTSDGVEVVTAQGTFAATRLVIAAGAWMRSLLLPLGLDLPLQPIAPQEIYFEPLDPAQFEPDRFPIFIAHLQTEYGNIVYGIPSVDGSGVKIALHTGPPIDPTNPDRTPDMQLVERMHNFAQHFVPQAAGSLVSTRVCLYTMTPDEHFIIDRHPAYPQIVIASCCSGHAFKFSTLLGSILSDLALTGETLHNIDLFRLSRFEGF